MVEHDLDVVRAADWLVDVGPGAGEGGGEVLYSGPPAGLQDVPASVTARYLQGEVPLPARAEGRSPSGWLKLRGVTRHTLNGASADLPLGLLTSVTGVSGSGKSSLVSGALVDLLARTLGRRPRPTRPTRSTPPTR